MGIVSTCPQCGGETWQYACPGCDAEEIARLKDELDASKELVDKLFIENQLLKEKIIKLEEESSSFYARY